MFRAVGLIIVLYAISHMMNGAFTAFEDAVIETFGSVEAAAVQSQVQLKSID